MFYTEITKLVNNKCFKICRKNRWGAPRQGGPSLPLPDPHLVFPLDQTRNEENVWNLKK